MTSLTAITGTAGTGKSLTVARHLLHNHSQYKKVYLNIEGFNVPLFRRATGNHDIQFITFSKYCYPDELLSLFQEIRDNAEDIEDESKRDHILFIYDEASYSLRDYSTRDETSKELSNFIALRRHYGPCDMIWMTQSFDKLHNKFCSDVETFLKGVPFSKRTDPENDIVFDDMDPDKPDDKILPGGRSKIKYKKLEEFTDAYGQKYKYFDFYKSGDGGRSTVRKNQWKKYVYLLAVILVFAFGMLFFTFNSIFNTVNKDVNSTAVADPVAVGSAPYPVRSSTFSDVNSTAVPDVFDKYDHNYNKIISQRLFKIFYHDNYYFIGDVVVSAKEFLFLVEDNAIRLLTKQPVTKKSYYISAMIDINVANALGLIKDFDFNDDGSKNKDMTLKND